MKAVNAICLRIASIVFVFTLKTFFFSSGEGGEGYVPKHFRAQAKNPRHYPQVPEQEKSQRTKGHLKKKETFWAVILNDIVDIIRNAVAQHYWETREELNYPLLPNPIYLSLYIPLYIQHKYAAT